MIASELEPHRPLQSVDARAVPAATQRDVPIVDSRTLLDGHDELRIAHRGAVYRLRQTALGKLILTK